MCLVDHGREVMTSETIKNAEKEIKEKLIDIATMSEPKRLMRIVRMMDVAKDPHDYEISLQGKKDGRVAVQIRASGFDLIQAIYTLMSSQNDFYTMIENVMLMHELYLCGVISSKNTLMKEDVTPEELDVLKTILDMKEEQRAEILKDIKK